MHKKERRRQSLWVAHAHRGEGGEEDIHKHTQKESKAKDVRVSMNVCYAQVEGKDMLVCVWLV